MKTLIINPYRLTSMALNGSHSTIGIRTWTAEVNLDN